MVEHHQLLIRITSRLPVRQRATTQIPEAAMWVVDVFTCVRGSQLWRHFHEGDSRERVAALVRHFSTTAEYRISPMNI